MKVLSVLVIICGLSFALEQTKKREQYERVGKIFKEGGIMDLMTSDPIILPQDKVRCDGEVTVLNFYSACSGVFMFQIWRPLGLEYRLLHSVEVETKKGINKVYLKKRLPVEKGDVLGLCPTPTQSLNIFTKTLTKQPVPITFDDNIGIYYTGSGCMTVYEGQVCPRLNKSPSGQQQKRSYSINAMVRCYGEEQRINSAQGKYSPSQVNCYMGNGAEYVGYKSETKSGITCQEWSTNHPHVVNYNPEKYPNKNLDSNFCRNPDNDVNGPWCYTIDTEMRFQYCDIPKCDDKKLSVGRQLQQGYPVAIGYDVIERPGSIFLPSCTVILANSPSKCDGKILSFSLWSTQDGGIRLQLWRYSTMQGFVLTWEMRPKVTKGFNKIEIAKRNIPVKQGDVFGFTSTGLESAHVSYSDGDGGFYMYSSECRGTKRGRSCKRLRLSSGEKVEAAEWSHFYENKFKQIISDIFQRSASASLPTQSLIRTYSFQASIQCDVSESFTHSSDFPILQSSLRIPRVQHEVLPGLSGLSSPVERNFVMAKSGRTIFLPGTSFPCDASLLEIQAFIPISSTLSIKSLVDFVVVQVWRPGVYSTTDNLNSMLFDGLKKSGFQLIWESTLYGAVNTIGKLRNLNVNVKKGDILGFTTKDMFGSQSNSIPFDTLGGSFYVSDSCKHIAKLTPNVFDVFNLMSKQTADYKTVCFNYRPSASTGFGRRTYSINAKHQCTV